MPKISVIVPVYKVEKHLHRCIDSILAQSYKDYELILVDDGSPDNCGYICDEYAKKYNRVVVIHKENGGLSSARNAGLDWMFKNSDSEWVTFIDSDDWAHPQYLEALYKAAVTKHCSISVCAYEKTNKESQSDINEKNLYAEIVDTEKFFCEHNINAVTAWGKLYTKSLFCEIRYPLGKLHEDEFVTYRLLFQFKKTAYISEPLYYYFINSEGITRKRWTPKRLDAMAAYKKQIDYFRVNGFKDAYKFSLCHIVDYIYCTIPVAVNHNIDNKTLNTLRKSLKKYLRISRKNGLFPFSRYKRIYERAYPKLMICYYLCHAVKIKLRRKF